MASLTWSGVDVVRLGALVAGRTCDVGQMLELRCDARFAVRGGWRWVAIEARSLLVFRPGVAEDLERLGARFRSAPLCPPGK